MAYKHTNSRGVDYYLHSKEVVLRGSNRQQTIYFFRKEIKDGSVDEVPSGFEVVENQRTGLPTLRRKQ